MIATHSLPIVRVRVPCANDEDYRHRRAAEFLSRGVVVPSERAREIGSRVRLRIELLDHTFAYDGEATVARSVQVGQRRGYLLKLTGGAETRPADAGGPGSPAATEVIRTPPASAPAKVADVAREAPAPPRGTGTGTANLASLLFSDLNLADAAAAAAAAAGVAPSQPATTPPRLVLATRPPALPAAADPSPAQPARVVSGERPSAHAGPGIVASTPEPPRVPAPEGRAPAATAPPRVLPRMELVTQEDDRDEPPARRSRPLLGAVRAPRRAAPVAAAVLLCAAAGGGALVLAGPTRADADAISFATELSRADERVRAGRLAGTGNDSALDHLVAARDRIPGDPRLVRRLTLFADLFGELGERALSRGDLEEAAVHFQAKLRADPHSASARQRLREIAERPLAPAQALRPEADARR